MPSLSQVFEICYTLKFWMEWNPRGVAVFFDSSGGGARCGFVIACFLHYIGLKEDTLEGFQTYKQKRYSTEPGTGAGCGLCVSVCMCLCVYVCLGVCLLCFAFACFG